MNPTDLFPGKVVLSPRDRTGTLDRGIILGRHHNMLNWAVYNAGGDYIHPKLASRPCVANGCVLVQFPRNGFGQTHVVNAHVSELREVSVSPQQAPADCGG